MLEKQLRLLRFIRLVMIDYKVFRGHNAIEFNRHRTLISGEYVSGKTTIDQVLYYMGVASGVTGHSDASPSVQNIDIRNYGNRLGRLAYMLI